VKALQEQSRADLEAAREGNEDGDGEGKEERDDGGRRRREGANMDMEILQLWALFTVHKIYVDVGIEYFASFLPFYYYLKMVIVLVTVIPQTNFPNFWFETILVPFMMWCHECMNVNWSGVVTREIVLLPWRLLDMTVLPGILRDDIELEEVKSRRRLALNMEEKRYRPIVLDSDHDDDISDGDDISAVTESSAMAESVGGVSKIGQMLANAFSPPWTRGNRKEPDDSMSSPVARSRVAASSLHIRKLWKAHANTGASPDGHGETAGSSCREDELSNGGSVGGSRTRASDKRKVKPSAGRSSSDRTSKPTMSSSRTRRTKGASRTAGDSGESAATSLKRRNGGSPSDISDSINRRRSNRSRYANNRISSTAKDARTKDGSLTPRRPKRPTTPKTPKNKAAPSTVDSEKPKEEHTSLTKKVRKFIIGDHNIRLRDYLFDLNLPSLPSPGNVLVGDDQKAHNDKLDDAHQDDNPITSPNATTDKMTPLKETGNRRDMYSRRRDRDTPTKKSTVNNTAASRDTGRRRIDTGRRRIDRPLQNGSSRSTTTRRAATKTTKTSSTNSLSSRSNRKSKLAASTSPLSTSSSWKDSNYVRDATTTTRSRFASSRQSSTRISRNSVTPKKASNPTPRRSRRIAASASKESDV